jgi:polyisoprenyl-teichoic acid--peptidoglycan teichoic acid transferase
MAAVMATEYTEGFRLSRMWGAIDILAGGTLGTQQLIEPHTDPPIQRAHAAEDERATRRRRRKAPIAAFWSFLVPGAGQLYNHQPRLALMFLLPVLLLVAALLVALLVTDGAVATRLLDPRAIVGLLIVDLAVLGWRLASIIQAHRRRARFQLGRVGTWVTAILVVAAVGVHGAPVPYALKVLETINTISVDGATATDGGIRDRIPGLIAPDGSPSPERPEEQDVSGSRTNVLLVGVDSGVGRDHALTDTMLVVSLDPGGRSAMLSIPRDLVNAPLPNGQPYPQKLNSLLQAASADPAGYPYGSGAETLKGTIGALLGVRIHHFAAVDLAGFEHVIDSVGGVTVTVESAIADESANVYLDPGPVFMDGDLALRYVRSRHGVGNNDFVRAGRQQQLLGAVQAQLARANLLTSLPSLLDAVQGTIATDVPSDRISELAAAIQAADVATMERAVIQPPDYVTPATGEGGAYILLPNLERIRELGQAMLGG